MKRMILIFIALLIAISCSIGQEVSKRDLEIQKTAPVLNLNGSSASIKFYNNDVVLQQSSNTLTMSGGDFALAGGYSLLMTGSVGSTASRILKGWFTNLESTNMPTVGGVSLATTFLSKSDTATMLTNYATKGELFEEAANYVELTDTATMLGHYIERKDTASMLSDYINKADTAAMLSDYINKADTSVMLSHYVERKDTATMLSHYIERKDTLAMLEDYINKADTAGMLEDYINKADTASMLTYYILASEVAASYFALADTASALAPYMLATDHIPFEQVDFADGDGVELEDLSPMLVDTVLLKHFEIGRGVIATDTLLFADNALVGSFYNAGSDTLVVTSMMNILAAGSGTETAGVQVSWHSTFKSVSATNLNASAYTVTSMTTGNEDVSFANSKIPPGVFVWETLSGISDGDKPSYLGTTLSGYKIPGIFTGGGGDDCEYTQNLVAYSEQLNQTWWEKTNTTISSTDAEYDLENNATMEYVTTTSTSHNLHNADPITVTPGATYRWSFDVKRGTMTELKYSIYDVSNAGNIVAPTSYYASTSTAVQRVSFEFTAPAGCSQVYIYQLRDSGVTGTAYFGRAQLETNGSCYVETTATPVTP